MDQTEPTSGATEGTRVPTLEEIQARVELARQQRRAERAASGGAPSRPPVIEVVDPMPAPAFRAALESTLARATGLIEQINARGSAAAATAIEQRRAPLSREEAARRAADRRARRVDIARAIGIPEDGAEGVFATALDHRAPATRIMRAFVERLEHHRATRDAVLFVASSPPGLGKTAGMCWAAMNQRTPALTAMFIKASDAATCVSWGESADTYRRMRSVPLLLLDEAGGEHDPSRITELIEYRWDYGLVTYVTTNLNRVDWWKRFGTPRMASRIGPHASVSKIAEFSRLPDLRDRDARELLRKAGGQ